MKNLFYILSLVICLTACGENAEDKLFINKNVKSFLEYTKIAGITPKIQLSGILTKMSELKIQLSDYKFSDDCQKCADYAIEQMTIIQNTYKSFMINEYQIKNYADSIASEFSLRDILKYDSCSKFALEIEKRQKKMQANEALLNEIEKEKPDTLKIRKYIADGADVNLKNSKGYTLLFVAVSKNNEEVTQILVEAGADVNAKNDNNKTALMGAVIYSPTLDIAKFLIKNGADINAKDNNGSNVLVYAFVSDNSQTLDIIKFLIENGADVNAKSYEGYSVLMEMFMGVINTKSLEITKFLVKSGIDVNARSINGMTALRYVAGSTSTQALDIIKFLIESGADVNVRDGDGLTILSVASKNGNPQKEEIIKFLKEHGAK